MSDINKTIIVGRLTKDSELSYTPSNNTALAKFSIAVNEYAGKGKDEEVNFFNVTVWGKKAEALNKYTKKGSQILIEGRLRQNRFEDKNGNKRSVVEIICENFQFMGGKSDNQPADNDSSLNNVFSNDDVDFSKPDNNEDIPF